MNQNDRIRDALLLADTVLRSWMPTSNDKKKMKEYSDSLVAIKQALSHVNKTPESQHVEADVLNKAGNVDVMRKALQEATDLLEAIPPVIEACEKVQADIYEMRIKCQQALAAQAAPTERVPLIPSEFLQMRRQLEAEWVALRKLQKAERNLVRLTQADIFRCWRESAEVVPTCDHHIHFANAIMDKMEKLNGN